MDDDRISDLAPFIIHQIMSHLSRKQVAQTSLLSKRWNHLRASFPIFDFSETDLFQSYLGMRLASNEEYCERIVNFMKLIDVSLLRFLLAAEKDVKELDITIKTDDKKLYILPHIIYSAKLSTTLVLYGVKFEKLPDTIRFRLIWKNSERVHLHHPIKLVTVDAWEKDHINLIEVQSSYH
ncbi:hypothetical protein Pint_27718 [Pistacia integerrima]|uniref:Uncharacterized protein n=1 Tax=Pistacia integerrima TaxID=434235 RepID=A0ACC0YPA9_9ROSI|nr:hypothetical protein Pint_27718 [Pistacia integerrima]